MRARYSYTADECEALKESVTGNEMEYVWGTRGPNIDQPVQNNPITHLSTQHLENILITQSQISAETAAAILMLLKQRYTGNEWTRIFPFEPPPGNF